MHRWRVSSAHSRPRACIITDLRQVKRQGGRCLTILRCSTPRRKSPWGTIRFADMQRSTISHPLIAQNNSTKQRLNWLHNLLTCPSTKSDLAHIGARSGPRAKGTSTCTSSSRKGPLSSENPANCRSNVGLQSSGMIRPKAAVRTGCQIAAFQ